MHRKRWFSTLLVGITTFLAGCKKSEPDPLVEAPSERPKIEPASEPLRMPQASVRAAQARRPAPIAVVQAPANNSAPPLQRAAAEPDDKGAQLLAKLLRPSDAAIVKLGQVPKKLSGPAGIERPPPALPRFRGLPARYPTKPAGKATPRDPVEPTPLVGERQTPTGPEAIRFSPQALERWPSPDTGEPAPLPTMASYVSDRASLAAPSAAYSRDAALAAVLPTRSRPLPFIRFNLPDPFENRDVLRTAAARSEKIDPVVATPGPLGK